jgi:chromosome segregation ATPase
MRRVILALLIVTLWTSAAFAQSSDAITQASRQVRQADSDRHKAIIDLTKEAARVRKVIEETPEWKRADAALKSGKTKYNAAVAAVRKSLMADPAYQRAQKNYQQSLQDREELRGKADATPEQRLAAATACLTASSAMGHIEQKAIENDTAADQAHTLIQQANDQIEELKKRFSAVAQKDAGYQAAKQKLAATETQLASAETNLNQVKAAQARADEAKSNQEIDALHNTLMRNAGVSR